MQRNIGAIARFFSKRLFSYIFWECVSLTLETFKLVQKRIKPYQNPIKHLRWSFLRKWLKAESCLIIFAKISILHAWQAFGYTSLVVVRETRLDYA